MPDERDSSKGQDDSRKNTASGPSSSPAIPTPHANQPHGQEVKKYPHEQKEISAKWGHNPDTWMVILTTILTLVGGYTAWVFYQQFDQMSKQTKILSDQAIQAHLDSIAADEKAAKQLELAGKQVRAAENGVKAVEKQMRVSERAWVGAITVLTPRDLQVGGHPSFGAVVTNTGKTPALNFRHWVHVDVLSAGATFNPTYPPPPTGESPPSESVLQPEMRIDIWTTPTIQAIGQPELDISQKRHQRPQILRNYLLR